jgi:hypothetical protein
VAGRADRGGARGGHRANLWQTYKTGSRELSGSLLCATGTDPLCLAPSARFERAAFSSAGRRSNPLSYEGVLAGRQGFEPWEELITPQPLSRRPRSSTPAPPPTAFSCVAEGEGFEPPVTLQPQRFSRPSPSSTRPSLRGVAAGPPLRRYLGSIAERRPIVKNVKDVSTEVMGRVAESLVLTRSRVLRPCRATEPRAPRCCRQRAGSSP